MNYAPAATSVLLGELTTREVESHLGRGRVCALLPVGSTEPHGPHLPLLTDVYISEGAARRAVTLLEAGGISTLVAPSLPYGVTDYAAGFAGVVGVTKEALAGFVEAIVRALLAGGFAHVCLVNNHLEPAHDGTLREVTLRFGPGQVSLASPLDRRFGRTLSAEFKSGACHAGSYETSLILAERPATVRALYKQLPSLDVSLSRPAPKEAQAQVPEATGQTTFTALGMPEAYTGRPSEATTAEGEEMYARLAEMIVTLVKEALG